MKQRDMFESIIHERKQMGKKLGLLGYPILMLSTFKNFRSAFNSRTNLNEMCDRMPMLRDYKVREEEWEISEKVCKFLEVAAKSPELQSGSSYVTLSLCSLTFKKLMHMCRAIREEEEISSIAELMLYKLTSYDQLVLSRCEKLARILDPRIRSEIISDGDFLRQFLFWQCDVPCGPTNEQKIPKVTTFFDELVDDSSLELCPDDEVGKFMRSSTKWFK